MIKKVILLLLLNFGALGIGGLFTGSGVTSEWYNELVKAPWTPPGWVFGTAWTLIMITFSFYVAFLYNKVENKRKLVLLYIFQWVLNVIWNPLFFHFNTIGIALISITALTLLIAYLTFNYRVQLGLKTLLISPYFVWLLIATSLNAFILIYN